METKDIISLLSKIRESANRYIIGEMNRWGVTGLVPSHGDILFALLKSEALTMKELAEKIGKDKSTVTALVDKLLKLGYLEKTRDTKDSRVIFVTLTESGKALKPMFDSISKDLMELVYRGITEKEKEELLQILLKIYHNF